jgi:hypothetical protein
MNRRVRVLHELDDCTTDLLGYLFSIESIGVFWQAWTSSMMERRFGSRKWSLLVLYLLFGITRGVLPIGEVRVFCATKSNLFEITCSSNPVHLSVCNYCVP